MPCLSKQQVLLRENAKFAELVAAHGVKEASLGQEESKVFTTRHISNLDREGAAFGHVKDLAFLVAARVRYLLHSEHILAIQCFELVPLLDFVHGAAPVDVFVAETQLAELIVAPDKEFRVRGSRAFLFGGWLDIHYFRSLQLLQLLLLIKIVDSLLRLLS